MLSLNPPHPNYFDAPEAFRDLYKGTELAWRPNLRHEADPGFSLWLRGNRAVDEIHRGYLAHISAIDHEIGRIVDRLETLGLSERTVVIYSADHGDMLGSHGRMGKRQPFEESIRIPLIARWKGRITPGMHLNTLIGVIDFIPTITGLAGVPAPDGLDGHDLSGVLRGEKTEEPEFQPIMHIFRDLAGAPNHPAEIFRGVRTQRFTYAATIAKDFVLYDLERDPYQLKNVIDDPAYATELERLQSLTAQWMREWEDPFRLPRAAQAALLDAGG